MVWADRNCGSNAKASASANHSPRVPAGKGLKSCLEPERSPDAHLIVIPTEEVVVTGVLAMEVINSSA